MGDEQCRMVTKNGDRCSRFASSGTLGFCWQHTPSRLSSSEAWKKRLEGAALAVAASEVLLKVVELAIKYLPEFFGSGVAEQNAAKSALLNRTEIGPYWPPEADVYAPGSRVDWVRLNAIVIKMDETLGNDSGNPDHAILRIERDFKAWFDDMNDFHKGLLLEAIDQASKD